MNHDLNSLKQAPEPEPVVEEVVCVCGYPVTYRLFFLNDDLFAKCVMCGTNHDVFLAMKARVESRREPAFNVQPPQDMTMPPKDMPPAPPPPPPKKSFFGGKKKESSVKSPV